MLLSFVLFFVYQGESLRKYRAHRGPTSVVDSVSCRSACSSSCEGADGGTADAGNFLVLSAGGDGQVCIHMKNCVCISI